MNDSEFASWTVNGVAQASAYASVLFPGPGGAAALEVFQDTGNAFIAAQAAQIEAENAAKNSTVTKKAAKQAWLDLVKPYNISWQINPAVTEEIRTKMQLPTRQAPGGPTAPVTPTNVVVNASANGGVKLKWKRNGNTSSATFIVEKQVGSSWVGVFASTRTRAQLSGYTPGVLTFFRIRAVKGELSSLPTEPVSIYGTEEGVSLQIAA